jgi:hypothetical protein
MKKTTLLPALALFIVAATALTAFSVKKAILNDNEVTFKEFLQQFPEQKLPYVLDESSLKARLDQYVTQVNNPSAENYNVQTRRLDWKFFKFLPDLAAESSFSRLPMQAEPVALLTTGQNYAVLYSTNRSYRSGYATYYLSVFDKKGEQISSNLVGKVMPEDMTSATISQNLHAELKHWKIEWKKDYETHGLDGNKIKGLSLVQNESIDLNKPTPKAPNRLEKLRMPLQEPLLVPEPEGSKTK